MQEVPHSVRGHTHKANVILTIAGHECHYILCYKMIMGFEVAWWIYLSGCECTGVVAWWIYVLIKLCIYTHTRAIVTL